VPRGAPTRNRLVYNGVGGPDVSTRHERTIRRLRPLAGALGLAGLIFGCGAESPGPAAGTPVPTPSTAPSVAPAAFAYVVDSQASALLAFEADEVTGDLRLVEARGILPAWTPFPTRIAADPRGRFVYALLANPDPGSGPTHTLRSFAVEGRTGRLLARGDAWVTLPPVSIAATEDRVHVLSAGYMSGYIGSWDVFAVHQATGALSRATPPPRRQHPSMVVADAEGGIVYTVAVPAPGAFPEDGEAMFASRWRDRQTLVDVDVIKLQRRPSDVALGGSLSYMADESGRISWRSLDARTGQIRLLGRVEAFEGGPARLALARPRIPRLSSAAPPPGTMIAVSSHAGLHLLEIGSAGEPTPRGSVDLPKIERVRRLAFHPSGRYLYTSGEGEGLRIFRVDPEGTLLETERETQGGGEIVLTAPPS
jgi:6-phosphogluconolactonase (cycloisomerase 2 family)